jgi:hypothetical protein
MAVIGIDLGSQSTQVVLVGTIKQRYQNRHSPLYRENDRFLLHLPALKVTDKRIKFLSEKPGQDGFLCRLLPL